jgi:hypothetical protein
VEANAPEAAVRRWEVEATERDIRDIVAGLLRAIAMEWAHAVKPGDLLRLSDGTYDVNVRVTHVRPYAAAVVVSFELDDGRHE